LLWKRITPYIRARVSSRMNQMLYHFCAANPASSLLALLVERNINNLRDINTLGFDSVPGHHLQNNTEGRRPGNKIVDSYRPFVVQSAPNSAFGATRACLSI
jgi:hypothetical protein